MPRSSHVAAFVGALALGSLVYAPAAQAATYTSTGARCTIVGTPGPDRLTGTAGRDVICGLGGNDVINGGGGNDIIDAGPGADTVNGGAGNDVIRGGLGADKLSGGDGADVISGGPGGDTITGASGPDDLMGNAGNDNLTGGSGADDLFGNAGNDDLAGNAGADDIHGGVGTNWCTVDAADSEQRCKYDAQPAASDHATLSTSRVDVTNQDRHFTVRVHVTDDTGVQQVDVSASDDANGVGVSSGYGHLVSGDIRNGWWQAELVAAHWSLPGSLELNVSLRDRVGRRSSRLYPDQVLTVVDAHPDVDLPTVASLISPGPTSSFDVRSSGQDVVVKARLTDAVSGVWFADMCLDKPMDGFYSNLPCAGADLVSGDNHDGVWRAVVRIPRGETGGDWNVSVDTIDWAHKDSSPLQVMGPDLYRYWTDGGQNPDPSSLPLPGGTGRFSVLGTSDSVPPTLDSLSLSPDRVDTLSGPVTVTFTMRAHDSGGKGITAAGLALTSVSNPSADNDLLTTIDLQLVSGTPYDGVWSGTLTLPQGSPPDTYAIQAWVEDVTHFRSYVSSSSPLAGDADQGPLPGDAQLTVGSGTAG